MVVVVIVPHPSRHHVVSLWVRAGCSSSTDSSSMISCRQTHQTPEPPLSTIIPCAACAQLHNARPHDDDAESYHTSARM